MIVVIDNFDSFTHNLVQYFRSISDLPVRVFRNDEISVQAIGDLRPTHIVISPGPGDPGDAGISVEIVRRYAASIPVLGVCLGHQVIGEAFGGRIVAAQRIVHGKTDAIRHDGRGVFRSIPAGAEFTRYHSLAVAAESLPPELEISARSDDGEIMGLRHREYQVEGVQFHPESIASGAGMKLLRNFLNYRREAFPAAAVLGRVMAGEDLPAADARAFMEELTDGNLTNAQIAGFLTAITTKGVAASELVGCASVLQRKRTPLPTRADVLDTCGTGGDGLGTFNISSLSALAAAACGARVAKHGNRAVTSRSGSADFYRALGIPVDITPLEAARLLDDSGFAFLFAPRYHGAMRHAGPARAELGVKTIMNMVGPLSNPAGAKFQLIGVFSGEIMRPMAEAARELGVQRALVVHGLDGQDELSVCGPTRIVQFSEQGALTETTVEPGDFGLATWPITDLVGGNAEENAAIARAVLQGVGRPAVRDSICLNAGAALMLAGVAVDIGDGVDRVQQALANGTVAALVERLGGNLTGHSDDGSPTASADDAQEAEHASGSDTEPVSP